MPDQPNADTSQAKDGTNAAGASGDDASTKYVTLEALQGVLGSFAETLKTSLNAQLGKAVNAAAAQHTDRQLKALGLTPEVLRKLTEPAKSDDAGGDAEADTAQAARSTKKDAKEGKDSSIPDFEALLKKQQADFEKRLRTHAEQTQKQIEEERALRQKAERARIEESGTTKARDILAKHVTPDGLKFALSALRQGNHLVIGEDGTPFFRAEGAGEDDEPIPFEQGLKEHFLKDPAAKIFLPPAKPITPKTPARPAALGASGAGNGTSGISADDIEAGARARTGASLVGNLFNPAGRLPTSQ